MIKEEIVDWISKHNIWQRSLSCEFLSMAQNDHVALDISTDL